ncbi:MAG TPA: molybdate ABC transporter substrate-binding protein, partial [Planctomycetaceae bacterium]|nr:molybdate ABC transporter substrate-binding protein [Planctomycetaceae bacterium]
SGSFSAQLSNEAPFDIFFSADIEFPRKLIQQGQAIPESEFQYAIGQLVVWVRKESPLDVESQGLDVLLEPTVKKIAIANPKHAPYGRAAEATLKTSGLYEKVSERLVLGENVAQAAQFIESEAADVGLIAHSLATAAPMKDKGRFVIVPADLYPKLVQGGVILSWAADRKATESFRGFMTGEHGRTVLKRNGFLLPGE